MKWLLYLVIFLAPFTANAQKAQWPKDVYRIYQCERYLVQNIALKQNGLLDTFARQVLTPGIKTIYVAKTDYIQDMLDSVNGYKIKLVNVDSMAKTINKEVAAGTAILLYLTDGLNLYEQYSIWIMPMSLDKKGRKYLRKYELTPSCKASFNFNTSSGLFTLTGVEYL
ncbi:MAG: hypothetical protein EOP51_10970 [Sphingobacteriales bacterium]|nr:MAG: hypothetical protein EOP51_10970 [Sphingobacteriales bacterium]